MIHRNLIILGCLLALPTHYITASSGLATTQQQFLNLQRSLGIVASRGDMNRVDQIVGPHGNQDQFNAVRSQLNSLLSQSPVNVDKIQQLIKTLEALKPARWPRANDYRDVLKVKVALEKGVKGGRAKSETPPLPTMEELQQQFTQIAADVGMQTSADKKNEVRKVRGRQGTQEQFAAVRAQLNYLLSKSQVNENDVAAKIKELADLNPAHWPRAEDYTALLKTKLAFSSAVASLRKQIVDRLSKASLNDADATLILEKIETLKKLKPTDYPKASDLQKMLDEKLGHVKQKVEAAGEEDINPGEEGQPNPRGEGQ